MHEEKIGTQLQVVTDQSRRVPAVNDQIIKLIEVNAAFDDGFALFCWFRHSSLNFLFELYSETEEMERTMAAKLEIFIDRDINVEKEIKEPVMEHPPVSGTYNHPQARQAKILAALEQDQKWQKETFSTRVHCDYQTDGRLVDLLHLQGRHSREYIEFVREAWKSAYLSNDTDWFNAERKELVPTHFAIDLSQKDLWAHLPMYKRAGLHGRDTITPIHADTWDDAKRAAFNSHIAAITLYPHCMEPQDKNETKEHGRNVHYALNRMPGHHAGKARYAGYCFFNNASLAAGSLQHFKEKVRVAILNLDYHHSDGTAEIFYDDPSVLTVSLHIDPEFDYPSFSGFSHQKGQGAGQYYHMNLPMPPGTKLDRYLHSLREALERIESFEPNALIIEFGGDTYEKDPDPSPKGGFKLQIQDYYTIGVQIAKSVPCDILVTQEGGYSEDIGKIVYEFLKGLCT